jgi:hypothetical protein
MPFPSEVDTVVVGAGDHPDTQSIQGAMASGRRAATAVLRARQTEPAR